MKRDLSTAWIAGVCSGLGNSMGLPPWLVRVGFCVGAWFFGLTIIVYLVMALACPAEEVE